MSITLQTHKSYFLPVAKDLVHLTHFSFFITIYPKNSGTFYSIVILAIALITSPMTIAKSSNVPLLLLVENNQISANITRAPLKKVLETLSQKANIQITLATNIDKELITLSLTKTSLLNGVKKILEHQNFVFFTPIQNNNSIKPGWILILNKDNETVHTSNTLNRYQRINPFNSDINMNHAHVSNVFPKTLDYSGIFSADTQKKLTAMQQIAQHVEGELSNELESILFSSLNDPDNNIRKIAFEILDRTAKGIPVDLLEDMLVSENNQQLRLNILSGLIENGGDTAKRALALAQQSNDSTIRAFAQEVYTAMIETPAQLSPSTKKIE